jgi:serpin B
MLLASAVCFRGAWHEPFQSQDTTPGPFWTAPQESVTVPIMKQSPIWCRFGRSEEMTVLVKPYRGLRQDMVILLPRAVDGLPELESGLASEKLESCTEGLMPVPVHLRLPRFSCSCDCSLVAPLSALGMASSFARQADFSRLGSARGRFIDDARHHARVDVDEKGTVAVAATLLTLLKGGPPEFVADHPFLFFIRDNATGVVLLLGRVQDPAI